MSWQEGATTRAWWSALVRVAIAPRSKRPAIAEGFRRQIAEIWRDDLPPPPTAQERAAARLQEMVEARRNSPAIVRYRERRAAALLATRPA